MNKKELFIFIVFTVSLFLISFTIAQEENGDLGLTEEEQKINLAYQCIEDKIGTDCNSLTQEEQAFSILALGDYEDCRNEFLENSNDEECWPSGNCKLKDTAIALLALDRINEDTSKIEAWLLAQTKPASDLTWFIEVDADTETICNIDYDNLPHTITINEDKTIASGAGSCLPVSTNGFWLEISSTCLEKEFTISCDQDFKSTLLYKTQLSPTIHVSQNLNSASAGGITTEKVTFKCFQQGTVCNYEGSLWASIALNKKAITTNEFIPYLEAFSSENKGFFPEVFLYILTSDNNLWTSILQDNFNGQSWQVGTYSRLYNTALAFMAVNGFGTTQEQAAKAVLLDNQESNGCFGSTKDTAFLLYTGWPRDIATGGTEDECSVDSDCTAGKECINGDCRLKSSSGSDCEAFGNYCELLDDCFNFGGNSLDNFVGCSGATICCSEEVIIPSCFNQGGYLCDESEQCPLEFDILKSSDFGLCCSGFCEPFIVIDEPTVNECELAGGSCKTNCLSGENEEFYSCGEFGGACCFEEEGSLFWVWVFLVAIVVVIILILLRNKIKLFFFRTKNKFKKSGKPRIIRPELFHPGRRPLPPRVRPHPPARPTPTKPSTKKDKDLEDTLKKLKEMSK